MNKNAILKKLNHKHEDFLKSIEDRELRDLIHKHSIITGGALASLLQGEYPNDFDYYFTNQATAKRVAEYYVARFIEMNPATKDTSEKMGTPEVVVEGDRIRIRIKSAGIVGENTDGNQYQYFESQPAAAGENFIDQAVEEISEADDIEATYLEAVKTETEKKYRPVYLTDNAITLSDKVQIIIRFYGSPRDIHKNFDFIHCMNSWIPYKNRLILNKGALVSILTKQLKYVGSRYPLCSVVRMRKFLKRGWNINAGQILKMCFQISQMDLTNIEVLEEQLVGVDTAYFKHLIQCLKDRKSENKNWIADQTYIASLVDRIFGD